MRHPLRKLMWEALPIFIFLAAFYSAPEVQAAFTPSTVCMQCHSTIYEYWKNSMHAKAYDDPVFQVSFLKALVIEGEKARPHCLSCHVPTTWITHDYGARLAISQEGVTCDVCHTISRVDLTHPESPFTFNTEGPKIGPFSDVSSPFHGVQYDPQHTRSDFSGGCHEMKGKNGIPLLSTYTEWKSSPYATQGIHCQNCHMTTVFNMPIVNPQVKKTEKWITDHKFLGGHAQMNLEKAAKLSTQVRREGNKALISVYITNAESGHLLPTGTPSRKVILTVSLKDNSGKELAQARKVYRKVIVDENGIVLEDVTDMLLKGVRIYSDNRIAPKEVRVEKFTFDIPVGTPSFIVESVLAYEFETPVMMTKMMKVEMSRDVKSVTASAWRTLPGGNWLLVLAVAVLVLVLVALLRRKKPPSAS